MNTVYITKNFKEVKCGTIKLIKDIHGNDQFEADRTVDNQHFTFYTREAADLWLRLGGMLHG